MISVVDFHEWNPTEIPLEKTYKQPIKTPSFQLKPHHSEMFVNVVLLLGVLNKAVSTWQKY